MPRQYQAEITDQRAATPRLRWLTLLAPELAREARPGQYLLVRCAEAGSYDPLLRRPLFVTATLPTPGQVGLLYEPSERGLAWLARGRPGAMLDLLGPFGHGFEIGARTRTVLLIGQGAGLAALLYLAHDALARGCSVTLLAGADHSDELPPPFLVPEAVEYETIIGQAVGLLASTGTRTAQAGSLSPISWADQIYAALPEHQIPALADAIRAIRYRWDRGFASLLHPGPLICGMGACGACTIELRKGPRLLCSDGPTFDLRDIAHHG